MHRRETVKLRVSGSLHLPRSAWVVLGGDLVSAVGSGATVPYLFVYLHQACGVAIAAVAALMTARALLGVAGAVIGGPLTDRLGAKNAAVATLTIAGLASLALAAASDPVSGLVAAAACTAACTMCAPALDALLAVSVPQERRQTAFAWRQTMINLGGAAGAALAALALGWWPAGGLRAIYILDGVSFTAYALLLLAVVRTGGRVFRSPGELEKQNRRGMLGGYREVLGDRSMRWLCVIVAIFTAAGFAQLQVGLPALVASGDVDVKGLGWMMSANMITILVFQLPVQRAVTGRRRASVLALALAAIIVAWILVLAAEDPGHGVSVLVTVGVVFGVAEMLFTPVVPALVNDLAPALTRGRYNGAQAGAWTGGWLLGATAAATLLTTAAATRVLFTVCILVLFLGLIAAVKLHRTLPSTLARIPNTTSPADSTAPMKETPEPRTADRIGEPEDARS
ncbi:MFS transporter [Streptomyces sp. NPDC002285]